MSDFLVTILEFVPEKRPTAAQCLKHPWFNPGPRLLEPSLKPQQPKGEEEGAANENIEKEKDEREAMEAGVGNIAIDVSEPKVTTREGRQYGRDLRT